MPKHCCDRMTAELIRNCPEHGDRSDCPDRLVAYIAKFDEYGIPVHDGGSSIVQINFCPWCGARLPPSRRDEWFAALGARNIDPLVGNVPAEFETDDWFRKS